ncbi:MAG TPA: lipopolysaccharide assembly protein LapA domain-containing protein [Jatrophihabitantaceae bacterium]|nr:lipopolysaccharide assembly protein LapA domain-containing protein [Jatrophihabitantaceae bacterium]
MRRTKVGGIWVALVLAAVLLILLIIFIAQNTTNVAIHFLGFNGHISLGLALLIGAVAGLLVAGAIGTVRIMQLRKALKRNASA